MHWWSRTTPPVETVMFMGHEIVLSHKPLDALPDGADMVFHGHVHTAEAAALARAGETVNIPKHNVNLCVEMTNYQPVSFRQALKMRHSSKEN